MTRNNGRLVTLFADSSFGDDKTTGHGWKFFHDGSRGEGSRKGVAVCNNHSEILGILYGVMDLKENLQAWEFDIVIQCDSLAALSALIHFAGARQAKTSGMHIPPRRIKFHPEEKQVAEEIRDLLPEGCKIWLKHVKGHSKGCNRTAVNNITDSLARKARNSNG